MSDRTGRYLYRCSSDRLLTHIGRIEESGDTVDWIWTGVSGACG